MAVREILHVGHPLLRDRSRELTREELASPAMQQLIDDLIDTMRAANGAGIAAPQVGELVRITTIEVNDNPRNRQQSYAQTVERAEEKGGNVNRPSSGQR